MAILANPRRFMSCVALAAALATAWLVLNAATAHADEGGSTERNAGHATQARHHSHSHSAEGLTGRLKHHAQRKADHSATRPRVGHPDHKAHVGKAVGHSAHAVRRTVADAPIVGGATTELKPFKRVIEASDALRAVAAGTMAETDDIARAAASDAVGLVDHLASPSVPDPGSLIGTATSQSSGLLDHRTRAASGSADSLDRQAGKGIPAVALTIPDTAKTVAADQAPDQAMTLSDQGGGPGNSLAEGAALPASSGISQGQGSAAASAAVQHMVGRSLLPAGLQRLTSSRSHLPSGPAFPPSSSPD